ncbi:MAG: methyl-accepting chemotaxis protein [Clostridiales bacterium]
MLEKNFKPIGRTVKLGFFLIIFLCSAMVLVTTLLSVLTNSAYTKLTLSMVEANNLSTEINTFTNDMKEKILVDKKSVKNNFNVVMDEVNKSTKEIEKNITYSKESEKTFNDTKTLIETYSVNVEKALKSDSVSETSEIIDEASDNVDFINLNVQNFINDQLTESKLLTEKISFNTNIIIVVILILVISLILFSLSYSIKITRKITECLDKLLVAANSISKGDFASKDIVLNTNNEFTILANAFNDMKRDLKEIVRNIYEISYNLFYNSNELKKSINQNLVISKQITTSISDISKSAENHTFHLNKNNSSINDSLNLAKVLNKSFENIKPTVVNNSELAFMNRNLRELVRKLISIKNSNSSLSESLEQFAVNSEEIAASAENQSNQYLNEANVSTELNKNAFKLDELVKNINIIE